jgi:MFS family permease
VIAPLRHRTFRLLFSGQLVSNLGDWLDFLALAVLIAYEWDRGPGSLAALAVTIAIPWAFIAPVSGVLADRWPKRPVMVAADLARAALVLGLVFAPNIWVLLPIVFAKTVCSTLFGPAEQATIRATVPEDDLLAANSLSQLATQATKVVGPALGGLIVAVWTPRVAFAVDSATFLVSAAFLSRLPRLEVSPEEDEAGTLLGELRAGLAYIAQKRTLLLAIASMSATIFLVFTFDTLSPLALQALGLGPSLFGFAIAFIGAGAVVGAIAIGTFGKRVAPFRLLGASKILAGLLVALLGFAAVAGIDAPAVVWLPAVLGIGLASAGVLVAFPTIIQLETPPSMMGRVFATAGALPTTLQLVAPIVGATVATAVGVSWVLLVAGLALAVVGAAVFVAAPAVGGLGAAATDLGLGLGVAEPDVVAHVRASSLQADEHQRGR